MAAAEVGCRNSCTTSKSQAEKGKLHEQKPRHELMYSTYILCRRDDVANWHLSLVIAETWKHLKTDAILSICLPTGLCVTSCPNIIVRWCSQPDRSSCVPKYRGKHQSWSCHFRHYIENHRNARKKTSQIECVPLHDNICNIPTIPMMFAATNSWRNQHFFVSLSSCKTSVMSLWISAMLDTLAMDPPAISCHEDQFPHVVEQINTTKKWHFFT